MSENTSHHFPERDNSTCNRVFEPRERASSDGLSPNVIYGERNPCFNKISSKVNSGINYYFLDYQHEVMTGPWDAKYPLVDIDFTGLNISYTKASSISRAETQDKSNVSNIIYRLLRPPPNAFLHGVISINWVIGTVGEEHFEFRKRDSRYVLKTSSALRKSGRNLKIPAMLLEWLCGDDEITTAADQNLYLTPQFFRSEVDLEDYY
ncbi:hypothetical protein BS50DRAFT_496451 [Corynespora cassiicola Philippines]|uniref:Uncharacterized protein n=1 Tax=Corynespora cassiicola Philippines TaxID=1448308 RepID=A0A2T2NJB6_CORCC|nr:hypothetical protein BS50DRAFT_496451 [Corynespora cassiicola Philippines]